MAFLEAWYPWIKAFHIASVIAWMAALFYLPRLFAYHVSDAGRSPDTEELFGIMERRLLRIIATPAMLAAWCFGILLTLIPGIVNWSSGWPWIKAFAILAMTWFHFWLAGRRRELATGTCRIRSRTFRIMNEVPTVLMLVIVLFVVVKPF